MPDRLCIFIDGSNFYNSLKDLGKPVNISFRKLAQELASVRPNRQLVQVYYYNSPLPTPYKTDPDYTRKDQERRKQQAFFNALRLTPNLTTKYGYLRRLPTGEYVEKRVDVMLATDLVLLGIKNIYDVAIVISCDADYGYAIETVKAETGKHIELATVCGSKSYDLRTICDDYISLDDSFLDRCLHP
jgi:uncharacterized LabA/DUF88 family protein